MKIVLSFLIVFSSFFIYSQDYLKGTTYFIDELGSKQPLERVTICWENTAT